MEIIIFQLLSCLYFYDSGIEVPVCIRKPSRSTVYQPERSYTVPSVNRLPAGAFIYRAVGQQTSGSVGSLRKVGRPSPGVQRVKMEALFSACVCISNSDALKFNQIVHVLGLYSEI